MTSAYLRRRAELAVDKAAPFAKDKLRFGELIPPLTRLLRQTPGPYVLAVSSQYGTGKSTFLRMWRAHLEQEGARTLFFDAWEQDFIEPPLTALVGEIESQVKKTTGTSRAKKALHVAGLAAIRTLGSVVAREALFLSATAAAHLVLGGKGTERLQELVSTVGDAVGDFTKDKIEEYERQKGTLAAFRQALHDFAATVHGYKPGSAQDRFLPLVFFIDELDRCRPTYAIELLETLKHLFAVPGVVFVLGINQDALSQSFQAVYGPNFVGAQYLRRFIDLTYYLPNPSLDVFCTELAEEFIPAIDAGIKPAFPYYQGAGFGAKVPFRSLSILAGARYGSMFRRSLRDLEQIFSRAGAALGTMAEDHNVEPAYFFFLLVLQDSEPELYAAFRDGKPNKISEVLMSKYGAKLKQNSELDVIVLEALAVHHLPGEEWEKRQSNLRARWQSGEASANEIIQYGLLLHGRDPLAHATNLVDLAQRFDSRSKGAQT